jgi:phosphoglycerol transferase MdoB-like AlkP superfamily enzyme
VPGRSYAWRASRTLVASLAVTVILAFLCNGTIEYLQLAADGGNDAGFKLGGTPFLFLLGTAIVWVIIVLLLAITGRLWLTVGISVVLTVLVGFANYRKLQLRLEPLYPSDVTIGADLGFLGQMVGWRTALALVAGCAVALGGSMVIGRALSRIFRPIRRQDAPRLHTGLVVTRLAAALLAAGSLVYVAHFNSPGNQVRTTYEAHGAQWRWWFQKLNYQKNGFVGGVLYNLEVPAMTTPPDYSRATMRQITRRYAETAARLNRDSGASSLDDVNVVVVLSEAFADPLEVRGPTFAEDPIPFARGLMSETTSGTMLAQHFGGGTANMEFEVLTGMSLSQFQPQMNAPFQQIVTDFESYPSVVGYLRGRGHRAVALHPYMTTMYKREQVYPILGFEEFVYDETMQSTETIDDNEFISDSAAFDEVTYQIERSDEPLLVNLVTMQNHYPMAGIYRDPIPVHGLDGDEREEAEGYARGLKHTDDALRDFIGDLERSPEKTVVLFYGDHQPAFWSEETRRLNSDRAMKETPFFVWSNFREPTPRELPTTSPIHFMPHVFEEIGAEIPPYYALLHELEQEVPAMEHGIMIGPDDEALAEADLSDRARELLRDYRLVQYDLSVGQRYSQEELFYPPDESLSASGSR